MPIDQATWRRTRKLGLIGHEPSKAWPGYTLYTPMYGDGTVYLLDMEGNAVHTWKLPYRAGDYGYVLPNGNLFYLGQTPDGPEEGMFLGWQLFSGGIMLEVDWDGDVVWEHRDPAHHHDGRRTADGGAVYLALERVPEAIQAKVQGGIAGSEHHGQMWADKIVEIDRDGNLTWEWHAHEHLDPDIDKILPADLRDEWSHGNTVVPLGNGDVMVSFRNPSVVARIDRKTGDFAWKLTRPLLSVQHDPSMLENGNVLIFNNGSRRETLPLIFSSVIEVEPAAGKVVWEYRDSTAMLSFFSSYISGAQRLPNGNTLITEGLTGRLFEVTPQAEIVWEYINPHFFDVRVFGTNNAVFRSRRYARELFPQLA
jgi:hypothetical protein